MAPRANPFVVPAVVPFDLFVAFWVPLTASWRGGQVLFLLTGAVGALLVWPVLARRRGALAPPPSVVDEDLCTGCTQCTIDCPYGAIAMVPRSDGRATLVARVDPTLCVSCGICAGSCAPMGIGPPGRTGRDQLAAVQVLLQRDPVDRRVVVVCCQQGAGQILSGAPVDGATFQTVNCAGNLHTSVIERLLRGGASGVLVLACHSRDCQNREGAHWLVERVYHDREAELQARVPRTRVRISYASARERDRALGSIRAFVSDMAALDREAAVPWLVDDRYDPELGSECDLAATDAELPTEIVK